MILFASLPLLLISASLLVAQDADISVRLRGGQLGGTDREGRLEIRYDGTWGTVCDDEWDNKDAAVFCRMLGFQSPGRALQANVFGPGSGTIWLDSVNCEGNERTILECQRKTWGDTDCTHEEDVGLACLGERIVQRPTTQRPITGPPATTLTPRICDDPDPNVQLMDRGNVTTNLGFGRVRIRDPARSAVFREVCDDRWGVEDAAVVCRSLCFNPQNARAVLNTRFGPAAAVTDFLLDEVSCDGDELSLLNCPAAPLNVHNCQVYETAGVDCNPAFHSSTRVPSPQVECAEGNMIVVRFSRLVEPSLRPFHLGLADERISTANCGFSAVSDANDIVVRIPFFDCGTTRNMTENTIIYMNQIRHRIPQAGVITRETVFLINVSCVIIRELDQNNALEPIDQQAPPREGQGSFRILMNIYSTESFQRIISSFPARMTLGDWVYVGIRLQTGDTSLKVIVHECTVSPTPERTPGREQYLIRNNCREENTVSYYPFNETFFAFRFQSFRFVNARELYIYVHCEARVCDVSEKGRCDRSCDRANRTENNFRRRRRGVDRGDTEMNEGPIVMLESTSGLKKFDDFHSKDLNENAAARAVRSRLVLVVLVGKFANVY